MAVWGLFVLLFVLIFFKVPIAFAMGLVSFIGIVTHGYPLSVVSIALVDSLNSFVMLAIPLFIMVGELLSRGRIAFYLVEAANSLVGFIKGGLALVNILTSMLFAKFSGSSIADAAVLGSIMIPEMVARGYPRDHSVAVTSVSASVGIVIPPSIAMLIYSVTADVSVARMFLGGIVPGFIFSFALMLLAHIIARRKNWPSEEKFDLNKVGKSFKIAAPALLVPISILGGIISGLVTVTEAAAIAVIISLLLALFVYKSLSVKQLPSILISSAKRSGAVMIIISMSAVFGWFLTAQRVPYYFAQQILGLTTSEPLIILLIFLFMSLAGIVIHGAPMIIMFVPIFLPLIRSIGMDPIHFGLIMIMANCVGQQTPPVASVLLTACSVGDLPVTGVLRAIVPYFLLLIIVSILIAFVPQLTLFLPNLILGP